MKERLLGFIDALRAAGVSPSVAETLDAMGAVGHVGIEREGLRELLAATLVKDHADRPVFDAAFDRFFATPGRQRGKGQKPQPTGEGEGRGAATGSRHGPSAQRRETHRPTPRRSPEDRARLEPANQRLEMRDAGTRLARQRALRELPFAEMSADDVEACDVLVEELARRFRAHLGRRQRSSKRGRLDIRRTLRRAVGTGGVPIDPVFRQRRPGRPDIIALCDYSHSVALASRFLLNLIAPARQFFRRERLFAYVDQPVEISLEAGHVVPHDTLDLYARSDFGSVLTTFCKRHESLLNRNTVLLVLGDARNNRRPPRADVLARLRALVRQVVWLNPEPRHRWNTGDSTMHAYAAHCDALLCAGNLRELQGALKHAFRTL